MGSGKQVSPKRRRHACLGRGTLSEVKPQGVVEEAVGDGKAKLTVLVRLLYAGVNFDFQRTLDGGENCRDVAHGWIARG